MIAGRHFNTNDQVEVVPTITVDTQTTDACQLRHYGFGSGYDDHALMIFGPGNFYNHKQPNTMGRYWANEEEKDPTNRAVPYTDFRPILYTTLQDVSAGEEMFETYGDNWFERYSTITQKTVTDNKAIKVSESDLQQYGHCLSDVTIAPSTLHGAGKGLFAARDFAVGEVVTISPALSLPRAVVDASSENSVLMNYCFAADNSDLVLFPLNYGPLINHKPNTTAANVFVEWFDWSPIVRELAAKYHPDTAANSASYSLNLSDKLRMTVQELFDAPFAQLDLAYRATRPIASGEELFLDYGASWQQAWEEYSTHVAAVQLQHQEQEQAQALLTAVSISSPPLATAVSFRHYMAVPTGLYPTHWLTVPLVTYDRTEL